MDDERRSWFDDLSDTYGAVRLWLIGLLGPVLVVSELVKGRVLLGAGLGLICVSIWTQLAERGKGDGRFTRFGNLSLLIGGFLLAWHVARSWVGHPG